MLCNNFCMISDAKLMLQSFIYGGYIQSEITQPNTQEQSILTTVLEQK